MIPIRKLFDSLREMRGEFVADSSDGRIRHRTTRTILGAMCCPAAALMAKKRNCLTLRWLCDQIPVGGAL